MVHMTNAALRSEECISYEFFLSLDQTEKIVLIQEWRSIEALEKHYNTPAMQLLANELPEVLAGQVKTKAYTKNDAQELTQPQALYVNEVIHERYNGDRTIH